jgi:cobalt-zinc-cadmium efflux system outer membrane protein
VIAPPVVVLVLAAASVLSAPDTREVLTLEQCLQIARAQSPLVHVSRARHEAAMARVQAARAWPYPVVGYDSDLQPRLFRFSQSLESYLGVSQLIEFPGKRSVRGGIADREAGVVLAEGDLVRLSLAFEVKRSFGRLLLARDRLAYAREDLELAREFHRMTQRKLEVGDVAQVEVLRARVEESKAANAEKVAVTDVHLARSRLAFLLARPADPPFDVEGRLGRASVPGDLDGLLRRALEVRPEIRQIELALARERLVEKQARLDALPDVEVGVAQHRIEGAPSTWDVTFSFAVPLYFWQPRRGPIAEARANRRALEREAENLRNAIRLEVEEAHANALSARSRIRLFEEEILKPAQEVHEMLLFSYQEGGIGGIDLIEARRTLVEARVDHADALFEYDEAVAALERAVGGWSHELAE